MATETRTTTDLRLVRASIVFVEPGLEAAFPEREEMVDACLNQSDVQTQVLARFVADLPKIERPPLWVARGYPPAAAGGKYIVALPPNAGRFLRVYVKSLAVYPTAPWDFESAQIAELEGIRRNLSGQPRPHPDRVRLPKSGLLAGPLLSELGKSEFGDEFINMAPIMGARPAPGHTILSGWIEVDFAEPHGDEVDFVLRWSAVGTPVVIKWGSGQENLFTNNRTFPTAVLPEIDTRSRGTLNLRTGKVTCPVLFATFQATTIAGVTRLNRIPNLFPYMCPPPQVDVAALPLPPDYQPPDPLPPIFLTIDLSLDSDRNITGIALHSKSFAPEGIFPYFRFLPPPMGALFPPFAWGPDFGIFWVNPYRCQPGTPPPDCPTRESNPDGIRYPIDVYFHPHIDLTSTALAEAQRTVAPPACAPEPIAEAVLLAADGRLYQIGGVGQGGVTAAVWIYDPAMHTWQAGPPLPRPAAGAQGAVVGRRLFVLGGWAVPRQELVGAVQVLDLATGAWDQSDWDDPVAESTATAVGEEIFVISGLTLAGGAPRLTNAVQIYDTRVGVWSKGQPASLPAAGASAAAVDSLVYVAGGRAEGDRVTRRTVVYDTVADQWQLGPELAEAVHGAALGRAGDTLYLAGGHDQDSRAVSTLQLLELSKTEWRKGLPAPLPVASAGGAGAGGVLYVIGGRMPAGVEGSPGELTAVAQTYVPARGWQVCDAVPVFSSAAVLNAAGLSVGPRQLAPGSQAILLAENLFTPQGPVTVEIEVGGKAAAILAVAPPVPPAPARVVFVLPPDLDPKSGQATLALTVPGSARQAPPVQIPVAAAAPGLFGFNFGEVSESWFLDYNAALACNEDGSLNFADQPAAPGQVVTLWATGLGKNADKKPYKLEVRMGEAGLAAKVAAIAAAPIPGVWMVTARVPDGTGFSNNVPVTVTTANGITSNRVVVSVRKDASRPTPPVPCQVGVETVFKPSFPPPAFRLGCEGQFEPLGG